MQKGFFLVEALIAIVILASVGVACLAAFSQALKVVMRSESTTHQVLQKERDLFLFQLNEKSYEELDFLLYQPEVAL